MAGHPLWVLRVLTHEDLDAIAHAVARAEAGTSGEIRVHLDLRCPGDALARAWTVFERLGMAGTAERTGVLIYVAIEDRKLAVVGDAGIHTRVPPDYWAHLRDALVAHLTAGRPREGLTAVVAEVGETLRARFPRRPDDRNELDNRPSLG